MSNVKIELNSKGIQELLKEVGSTTCMEMANEAANRCGKGYIAEKRKYPERTAAIVKTDSHQGYRDNMKNNTIVKAVWGGRS